MLSRRTSPPLGSLLWGGSVGCLRTHRPRGSSARSPKSRSLSGERGIIREIDDAELMGLCAEKGHSPFLRCRVRPEVASCGLWNAGSQSPKSPSGDRMNGSLDELTTARSPHRCSSPMLFPQPPKVTDVTSKIGRRLSPATVAESEQPHYFAVEVNIARRGQRSLEAGIETPPKDNAQRGQATDPRAGTRRGKGRPQGGVRAAERLAVGPALAESLRRGHRALGDATTQESDRN